MLLWSYLNKRPSVPAKHTTWHATESVSLFQFLCGPQSLKGPPFVCDHCRTALKVMSGMKRARFAVLTAVAMKIETFRDIATSRRVKPYQVSKKGIAFIVRIKRYKRTYHPSRGKHHGLSKRRWKCTSRQGVTTQKAWLLIKHTRFNIPSVFRGVRKIAKSDS